jgi:hypothetical protein
MMAIISMKAPYRFRFLFQCLVIGAALALFIACSPDGGGPGDLDGITVVVSLGSGPKYFSLTTGQEVTGGAINTTAWDIGFQRSRRVYTNGGDTAAALGSGGVGEVWYTEKFNFDEASFADAVTGDTTLLKDNTTDRKRFIYSMSSIDEISLNVIGFVGYSNENETNSYGNPWKTFQYNKKQFYASRSFDPSKRVYIIKHGDGAGYSKIQITDYESNSAVGSDTYIIRYENF